MRSAIPGSKLALVKRERSGEEAIKWFLGLIHGPLKHHRVAASAKVLLTHAENLWSATVEFTSCEAWHAMLLCVVFDPCRSRRLHLLRVDHC